MEVHQVAAYCGLKNGRPSYKRAAGHGASPALFIIDERGKIIYGDVSFDPSLKFILAQRRPN